MDVNGDGKVDILSGSYSRKGRSMAGLFQVLHGNGDGTFQEAQPLQGSDGKLLILGGDDDVDRICTRPVAADLNGDGHLDIVSGNFKGTVGVFYGHGPGQYAPQNEWLQDEKGDRLQLDYHSDPFLIDWDGDGDLDILAGGGGGGVTLRVNVGSKSEPRFGRARTLVSGPTYSSHSDRRFGDAHVQAPARSTRVWVDDINGDGKLDLLVGDSLTLRYPADGMTEAEARAKWKDWDARGKEFMSQRKPNMSKQETQAWSKTYSRHYRDREQFLREDRTGFVWVYYQKSKTEGPSGAGNDR